MLRGLRIRIIAIQGTVVATALILMGIVFYQIQKKDIANQFVANADVINDLFRTRTQQTHRGINGAYGGLGSLQALNGFYLFSQIALVSSRDAGTALRIGQQFPQGAVRRLHAMLSGCTPGLVEASGMRMIKLFPVERAAGSCTSLAVVSNSRYLMKHLLLFVEIIAAYVLLNFFILTVVSWFIIDRYTVIPLEKFEKAVEGVSEGDYPQIRDMPDATELRKIVRAFNTMTGAVRTKEESLRQTIRELRETQGLVIKKERLATIGTLASGISHEIGNPLSAIISILETLKRGPPSDAHREAADADRAADMIDRSLKEAYRIDALIKQMLLYVRQRPVVPTDVNIRSLIQDVIGAVELGRKLSGIELAVDADRTLVHTTDYEKLRQVLTNLLTNAVDALPEGGTVRMAASRHDGSLVIDVSDTGQGIADKHIDRIFEPFFTTKAPNKGTGLGLAIVKNIVLELGGEVSVRSESGRGTTFTVRLP
ncbi:MAG: HAMP domain-containing histidine kinase [Deltaproteobacteria bacterium]|nr:HAMP domain-containing histidine kinase [Deltaproteobacteria bacterium]